MLYDNLYMDVSSSLLKFCKDYIDQNSLDDDFDVFDFDAHASLNDIPTSNLIGIAEYSLTEFNDQYEGEAMLIISSNQDDANLVVMRPHVTKLFNLLKTGMEIPIIRSVDGYMLGNLKLKAGSSVMPVARTQSRPLQAISFSFGLALISQPTFPQRASSLLLRHP